MRINRTDTYAESSSGSSSGSGNNSSGSSGSDSPGSDSSDSSSVNFSAPDSLDGKVIDFGSALEFILNARRFGFADGKVTIMPVGTTGTYRYSKSSTGSKVATLTIDCPGTNLDTNGALTLTFTAADKATITGKIGLLNSMTAHATITTGTVDSGGVSDTGGYPSTLAIGTVIKFTTSINMFRDDGKDTLTITGANTATMTNDSGTKTVHGTFTYIPGENGAATLTFKSNTSQLSATYPMLYQSKDATGGTLTGLVSTVSESGDQKLSYKGGFTVTKP